MESEIFGFSPAIQSVDPVCGMRASLTSGARISTWRNASLADPRAQARKIPRSGATTWPSLTWEKWR